MSEQQVKAGKVDEAEEVLDVVFPSGDEAAEVVHPGKESLHLPAFSIAAELAAILCSASHAMADRCSVRADHIVAVHSAVHIMAH